MKRTPIFYIKTAFLITGFLNIVISFFIEFQTTCDYVAGIDSPSKISVSGFHSPMWYLFLIGSTIIFSVGYFSEHKANRIAIYIFSILFSIYTAFVTWLSSGAWGKPCGLSSGTGYYLTLFGSLFVLTATIISMNKKKTSF